MQTDRKCFEICCIQKTMLKVRSIKSSTHYRGKGVSLNMLNKKLYISYIKNGVDNLRIRSTFCG